MEKFAKAMIATLTDIEKSELSYLLDGLFLEKRKKKRTIIDDEKELANELRKVYKATYKKELQSLKKELLKTPEEDRAAHLSIWQEKAKRELGEYLAKQREIVDLVEKKINAYYGRARAGRSKNPTQRPFNDVDKQATESMTNQTLEGFGNFYPEQVAPKVEETVAVCLDSGGTNTEFAERITREIDRTIGNTNNKYFDVTSSSALVRSRSCGELLELEEYGVKQYEIFAMMDERTCFICREMDGRVFEVAAAAEKVRDTFGKPLKDLKEAIPWQTAPAIGRSSKSLAQSGQCLPPFHGRCRCLVVMHEEELAPTQEEIKEEITELFPAGKQGEVDIASINADTRIAEFRSNYFSQRGLENWKYDLIKKDGKIWSRGIYNHEGRLETEIHFENHGNPKDHDAIPHVHRWAEKEGRWTRSNVDKEALSWEKEVIENIPEDKIRKEKWTWLRKAFKWMMKRIFWKK